MKTIMKCALCLCMLLIGAGCEQDGKGVTAKSLDVQKNYELKSGITLKLRGVEKTSRIEPANTSEDFIYWEEDGKDSVIYDIQFYAKNNTKKEINLAKMVYGEIHVQGETIKSEFIQEGADYKQLYALSTMKPETRTILHMVFYVDKQKAKDIEKDKTSVQLVFDQDHYKLPLKKLDPEVNVLERNKEVTISDIKMKVISASTSLVIPPLAPTETSLYYQQENQNKRYTGMYIEIENLQKDSMDVKNILGVKIDQNGVYTIAWMDMLTPDNSDFMNTDSFILHANEKRSLLIFGEVDAIQGTSTYTMHLTIDGIPYQYTYSHTNYI